MIIDDKMVRSTLFEAVEETMRIIISHLKVDFEITGKKVERTEIFEYPLDAIREIVLNYIIHRDYTSPVDNQIKIFDQKIVFFNPRKLYSDLTIEQLKTDSFPSRTRNKLIAEAFYLTGDIEKYGSGYQRIRKAIQDYPTMTFNYEESGDGYMVTVEYSQQKQSTEAPQEINDAVKAQEKAHEGVHLLNPTEQAILKALKDGYKSSKQLLEAFGYKSKTGNFNRAIAHLLDIQYIQMTQPENPKSINQAYRLNADKFSEK